MIKSVHISTIKHKNQRYPTAGDWLYDQNEMKLTIYISDTGNWREVISVAIHELTEAVLCLDRGVSQKQVDEFDLQFEEEGRDGDPGDSPDAPYYDEHKVATLIEKMLAKNLRLKWKSYEKHLEDLDLEWGE